MSKSCGITGPLHSMVRNETKTASGEKSVMQDVFPDAEIEVYYEVNRGTKKKPLMEKVAHKVRQLVRQYVIADNHMKSAKEQAEEAAQGLRVFAREFRAGRLKETDKYQRTYRINGETSKKTQFAVSCAAQDRFSLPKKEKDIDAIREIVGKDFFKAHFERELSIEIRKEVLEDRKLRRELTDKLLEAFGGEEELKKWFVKDEKWSVKPGLDEAQYELDDETREAFQEACPQYGDQIKNATYDPKDV